MIEKVADLIDYTYFIPESRRQNAFSVPYLDTELLMLRVVQCCESTSRIHCQSVLAG